MSDLKTRYIGTCPICESEYRLHKGKLVHHGYRRPGDGMIHGDCFCVYFEPYEVSDRGCRLYKTNAEAIKASLEKYLEHLNSGNVRQIDHEVYKGLGSYETVILDADSKDPVEQQKFKRALEYKIQKTEYELKNCVREIERMERLIRDWTLKPIKTLEEAASILEKAAAERRAEREAKKAKKTAKLDAIKAKKERWAKERQELITKYKTRFEQTPRVNRATAVATWVEMHKEKAKKGYLDFQPQDLECDEVLKELGLVVERTYPGRTTPFMSYADKWGYIYPV